METSLNLSRFNKNNLDTARILSACSVYHPTELLAGKESQISESIKNMTKNKIIPEQQLLADRLVGVLEKSLILLIDRLTTKLEEGLNKVMASNGFIAEEKTAEAEMPATNQLNVPQEKNCNCLSNGELPGLINNQQLQQNNPANSALSSFLQDSLVGISTAVNFKDSFDGMKDLFGGLFESIKKFLKKPAGMLKSLFKGGIFSGAAKLLGGLF